MRMTIFDSPANPAPANVGFVGIGNIAPPFEPQNILHVHENSADPLSYSFLQFTNLNTGATGPKAGFRLGIRNNMDALFFQQNNRPILFHGVLTGAATESERLRITEGITMWQPGGTQFRINKVTVSRAFNYSRCDEPVAMFNIGVNGSPVNPNTNFTTFAGNRPWMDVGTFMSFTSDNMYVGLKREGTADRMDAVINFGDNVQFAPDQSIQNLRIIFTSSGNPGDLYSNGPFATFHGMEVARFSNLGDLGIGDFYNNNAPIADPYARLEILDSKNLTTSYPTISLNRPQLRLTFTQDVQRNLGIHTDFQNTSQGNLIIRTLNQGSIKYTGIGDFHSFANNEPQRRLDVLDNNENAPQLRLTFTPAANVTNGIFTDFQTTSAGDLFINPSFQTGTNNPVNRFVGINNSAPQNTLDINSTIGLSPRPSGLRFSNLNSASANDIAPNGRVLSLDGTGNVVLTTDVGSGSTNLCNPGPNILTRTDPTNPTQLVCSDIWNDFQNGSNSRVGVFTAGQTPAYPFHVVRKSMFTDAYSSTAYSYAQTITGHYTVGIKSDMTEPRTGLGIFSDESPLSIDRLNIYADGFGIANINANRRPIVFRDNLVFYLDANSTTGYRASTLMGTNPNIAGVVLKPDYYENTQASNSNDANNINLANNHFARLWVESNDNNPVGNIRHYPAIVGLNTFSGLTNGDIMAGRFSTTGIRGGTTSRNIGGYFIASGTKTNIGLTAESITLNTNTKGINCGGFFRATKATNNYAVWAMAPATSGSLAGYFNGITFSSQGFSTSDEDLKEDILLVDDASQLLAGINVYSFNFKTNNPWGLHLPDGRHYGLIAQEIEGMFPEMVRSFFQPSLYDSAENVLNQEKEFKAINYDGFTPLLIKVNQELITRVTDLENRLDECCESTRMTSQHPTQLVTELTNVNAIILNQNEPNPFAENTTITWNIPEQELKGVPLNAMLVFYNNSGVIINKVTISATGPGSLLVYSSKLSAGVYSYSLVVSGKTVDTKRMVKN